MALEMQRHPCGIIYTTQFADYLHTRYRAEESRHPGELLSLEFVHCAEGEKAGSSWLRLDWTTLISVPAVQKVEIGQTPVSIHRQSLRALKNRLLHCVDGEVLVKQ